MPHREQRSEAAHFIIERVQLFCRVFHVAHDEHVVDEILGAHVRIRHVRVGLEQVEHPHLGHEAQEVALEIAS